MEILTAADKSDLLRYLPYVKTNLREWLLVDVRLTDVADKATSIESIAEAVHGLFKKREGKLYILNAREILMIVRWGTESPPSIVADNLSHALPEGECEVAVQKPEIEGLAKLEILIKYRKPITTPTLADLRAGRRQNIIIVADDDLYMRMLVKKGVGPAITVAETADGANVFDAYRQHNPDILFLDIHLPNVDGTALLAQILTLDPKAYIIMLSADSSFENVRNTALQGAKGFLTKPFTKEKLVDYISKCPTLS